MASTKKQNHSFEFASGFWDLMYGEHPNNAFDPELFKVGEIFSKTNNSKLRDSLTSSSVPLTYCEDGHNLMADHSTADHLNIDIKTPISPIFVRDLAGRTIYIGYGPEKKARVEWGLDNKVTFPRGCFDVTESIKGSELIENVFLTRFRTLDMTLEYRPLTLEEENLPSVEFYNKANLYPYKLRLDTFYQDGWRLPQTQMLYVKPVEPTTAKMAADELINKWNSFENKDDYESFYDKNGGEEWFETLFEKGCTVIPTVECFNGFNKVDENFELEEYWPGRAVEGLHEVVERLPNSSPEGTIIKVIEPGFMLANKIKPARVVVSNGAHYVSRHGVQEKHYPNLNLPHTRTISKWGVCWIPTEPSHFEHPAIWGWSEASGRFLQLEGPLWDPLHYYYQSVDEVVRAFKEPYNGDKNIAEVPEHMKNRFYPVSEMHGFDYINPDVKENREAHNISPDSAISRFVMDSPTVNIGYHPLPLQFEYELDSWWFPALAPNKRITNVCPSNLSSKLVGIIHSTVSVDDYLMSANNEKERKRLNRANMLANSQSNALLDYPFMIRYRGDEVNFINIIDMQPFFLDLKSQLSTTASLESFGDEVTKALDGKAPRLISAINSFKESSKEFAKLRLNIYENNLQLYISSLWKSTFPERISDAHKQYIAEILKDKETE